MYSFIDENQSNIILTLRVRPSASLNDIEIHDDELIIKLRAIPQKGKANRSLIKYISDFFEIKKKDISIISGFKSRNKIIQIPLKYKDQLLEIIGQQSQKTQ